MRSLGERLALDAHPDAVGDPKTLAVEGETEWDTPAQP
jgi:hypothetical protein